MLQSFQLFCPGVCAGLSDGNPLRGKDVLATLQKLDSFISYIDVHRPLRHPLPMVPGVVELLLTGFGR